MADLVEVTGAEGPVAEVRLARPEKKNAVTLEMLDALTAAGEALAGAPGLRAVVLTGTGGDFCAGIDTGTLMAMAGRLDALKAEVLDLPEGEIANRFQKPAKVWRDLPVPVIAAIEGVCFGAGMQIALGCDVRIAAPAARLSIMEARWGLIPDMGLSLSLPRLMQMDRALELILTARVLSGTEAAAAGLVTRVADDPLAAARALADEIAGQSPDAVRAGKALATAVWGGASAAEGLRLEAVLQARIMGAPDQVETVMARMGKRAPVYR